MLKEDMVLNDYVLPEEGFSKDGLDLKRLGKLLNILERYRNVPDLPEILFAILKIGSNFDPHKDKDIFEFIERANHEIYNRICKDESINAPLIVKRRDGYYRVQETLVSSLEPSASGV